MSKNNLNLLAKIIFISSFILTVIGPDLKKYTYGKYLFYLVFISLLISGRYLFFRYKNRYTAEIERVGTIKIFKFLKKDTKKTIKISFIYYSIAIFIVIIFFSFFVINLSSIKSFIFCITATIITVIIMMFSFKKI